MNNDLPCLLHASIYGKWAGEIARFLHKQNNNKQIQEVPLLQRDHTVLCNIWKILLRRILCYVAHTHTHPFNGPFSGTTQVSRYQKGKTNLDFTEERDSEWQWYQLDICKSAPCSRQITMPAPHHSIFYRPDALPAAQPTALKHWRKPMLCSSE